MAFVMAMMIIASSLLPVQARLISGEGTSEWSASSSPDSDLQELQDGALYISEENDEQSSRKGPSHRLGLDDPLMVVAEIPAAVFIPILQYDSFYLPPHADSGLFLSFLKTGPPTI